MEAIFIYLVKVSGLLTAFYVAYYFFLRKETFFNSNRWYLLAGLVTAVSLPLITFTQVIFIDPAPAQSITYDTAHFIPVQESASIDWILIFTVAYVCIAIGLFLKVTYHLSCLIKTLYQRASIKKGTFSLIHHQEDHPPFSFFNFIVLNPDLYTNHELESILSHEKVHSSEKHSIDVLVANLFCVLFWFNPFVWWYKKAIIQNLEYIADQKAVQSVSDKTAYQKALLKVVSHQNFISITNPFYQSLIKKRIVMLNTHPSKKQNLLKYLLVLPILIGFIIFFQVKVVAQERLTVQTINPSLAGIEKRLEINKNTSDAAMTREKEVFKKEFDTDLKFSKVKRNSNGELTSIKVDVKTPNGKAETYQFSGSDPIQPFVIALVKDENGMVTVNYGTSTKKAFVWKSEDAVVDLSTLKELEELDIEIELPDAPDAPDFPDHLDAPAPPAMGHNKKIVIVKENNGKATVTINGKVVEDPEKYLMEIDSEGLQNFNFDFDWETSDGGQVNREKVIHIKKEAIEKARMQMDQMRPEMEKSRIIMLDSKSRMESSKEEMEQAKKEMELAKIELLKAKEELEKAKKELEAAKLKKQ
jgi:BlaR1 peptidase M56